MDALRSAFVSPWVQGLALLLLLRTCAAAPLNRAAQRLHQGRTAADHAPHGDNHDISHRP